MKVLRLQLNKNIAIVEYDSVEECNMEALTCMAFKEIEREFIIIGYGLTDEIAKSFILKSGIRMYFNHHDELYHNAELTEFTALKSFISAVEKEGYYWGKNPIKYPDKNNPKYYDEPFTGKGFYQEIYSHDIVEWKKIQEKTFNLDKTLIFEITL